MKISRLARLAELFPSAAHLWLFARVAAWLAALPVLVRVLSLPKLMTVIDAKPGPPSPGQLSSNLDLVQTYLTGLLNLSPKHRQRGACLQRSLVLFRYARRAGHAVTFFVGVKKEGGRLEGHSWIEIDGERRFDPRASVSYSVTFSFPGPSGPSGPFPH